MGGAALSAGGLAGVDPGTASFHPPDPQRPVLHLESEWVRTDPCVSPAHGGPQTPHFRGWPAEGGSVLGSGKPMPSPSSGPSPSLLASSPAPRPLPASHSIWPTLSSPGTHLHLTLALAEVLSSELPSHTRLGAAAGRATQGHRLQFPHFQHLGRCLQELRGRCKERGIRDCQRGHQPKEQRPRTRETDQGLSLQPISPPAS